MYTKLVLIELLSRILHPASISTRPALPVQRASSVACCCNRALPQTLPRNIKCGLGPVKAQFPDHGQNAACDLETSLMSATGMSGRSNSAICLLKGSCIVQAQDVVTSRQGVIAVAGSPQIVQPVSRGLKVLVSGALQAEAAWTFRILG